MQAHVVARFGAAEEAMLPPANGWLQGGGGVDEEAGGVSGVDGLTCHRQRIGLDCSLVGWLGLDGSLVGKWAV